VPVFPCFRPDFAPKTPLLGTKTTKISPFLAIPFTRNERDAETAPFLG
jgi:hypothetical protein